VPFGFVPRVARSFEVVHRRVQDSAVHRLHHLKQSGMIKGFILPYLGQQDGILPFMPPSLVPRSDVIHYPTDFAAMSEEWIEKLSSRGEQLTRGLLPYYLPELL
jgi:NTE family protein